MIRLTTDIQEKVFDALSSFLDKALTVSDAETPWDSLRQSLHAFGVSQSQIDVFLFWASGTLNHIKNKTFPYRVLHDMEKELISQEAYGFMLESIRLGFIEPPQTEFLLEELAIKEHLPLSQAVMKKTLIKNWVKTLNDTGIKSSH